MKIKHILIFFISITFTSSFSVMAQDESSAVSDTITKTDKYGLRVGADLSKPIRSFFEDDYTGFEVMADFRVTKKFYAAVELGNESKDNFEENLKSSTSGSYAKIGFNFNAYNNWLGMNNEISAGLRYGFSTFKQELLGYAIYTEDNTFPNTFIENPIEYKGLTAHWAEFIMSIKTEIYNNLFLSINFQLKRKVSEDKPENFNNLFIPGFNRTYDFSEFGAGYGYTLSYLIPLFNK